MQEIFLVYLFHSTHYFGGKWIIEIDVKMVWCRQMPTKNLTLCANEYLSRQTCLISAQHNRVGWCDKRNVHCDQQSAANL